MASVREGLPRWLCLALPLSACWPGPLTRVEDVDAAIARDLAGSAGFQALAPCLSESSYVGGNGEVRFGGAQGTSYAPRCLTISVGQSVDFIGDFGDHPLRPSSLGSTPTPITSTQDGTSAVFAFPAAGYFPYYCAKHGSSSGSGMAGVVRVLP